MPADEFVRGLYLSRLVGGADLHAGRSGLPALADGRVHGAARGFAARFCFNHADRPIASGKAARESVAGISRLRLARRLRRVRVGLHCGRDVSRPGTAAQDASTAFHFLSSAAAHRSLCCDHAPALVWILTLHARTGERVFCWPTLAMGAGRLRHRRLGALRCHFARPASSPVFSETRGRALHYRI